MVVGSVKVPITWYDAMLGTKVMGSMNVQENCLDSKVHGANMGIPRGRQEPGGPQVGHVNLAIWVSKANWQMVFDLYDETFSYYHRYLNVLVPSIVDP